MTKTLTMTSDDVPMLIERKILDGGQYMEALSFLRDESLWKKWAIGALFALAVGHILSGIIFFFAFNWNDISGMMKFAVVGAGIGLCILGWIIARLDTPAGQALGIGATVLVGVMFAVLGQVYQTPAMIHTPFVFWAVLTLPFALTSRNLAHWTVWIVILTVAISSYANSGLRLAGNDLEANFLNIAVAGGFVIALIALDKMISSRLNWARAEWFRVLLVLGAIGFGFLGFTEDFWDHGRGLWCLSVVIGGGLIWYLYSQKPSLATLSLASFGGFALIVQLGFKVLEHSGINDDTGVFFLIFIWLAILTVGLVALFRHFMSRFGKVRNSVNEDESPSSSSGPTAKQTSASEFAQRLGADRDQIAEVLGSEMAAEQPWYMSVFIAAAGFLTAIIGCLFFGSFLGLIIGFDDEIVYGILGLIIFGGSILGRRTTSSHYLQHLLNTMITIGGVMTVFGFAVSFADPDPVDQVVGIVIILSMKTLILVKDSILEFGAAAAIITAVGCELYHLNVPMVESFVLVISTGLGVFLLSRPLGTRLYKSAATAFLMAPAVLGIALVHAHRWDEVANASAFSDAWLSRAISVLVLIGAVFYLNRGKNTDAIKPPLLVLIPLVIGAGLVPLGGASALLLMLTGYIFGSRSLAIIGTLLQIYFLTMFYYDLSFDLLTKSVVLLLSGIVFLGVYIFIRRHEGRPA